MKIAAVILAVTLVVGGAMAQGKGTAGLADNRAMFEAMYNHAETLFAKKDVATLSKMMTADFTETAMGKTSKKAEAIAGLTQFMNMFKTVKCEMVITSCKINGNTAIVANKARLSGTSQPDPKTKKSHKLDATRDEVCTWVKVKGQWMLKHLKGMNEKMMMDGKPMPMGGG